MLKYILILAVVVVLLVLYFVKCQNTLRRLRVKVDEAKAGIDVALEKRFDLLTNELAAFKKVLQHEKEIYTQTAESRGIAAQKAKLSKDELDEAFQKVSAIEEDAQKLKSEFMPAGSLQGNEKMASLEGIGNGLQAMLPSSYAVFEQYPVIYSTSSAEHFQKDILNTEEHLQAARRLYNSNVSIYNQHLCTVPFSFVAGMQHMEKAEFFKVEEEKKTLKLDFD